MTNYYDEVKSGVTERRVSRRTIAAGAALAVPTVALATTMPAFAASGEMCYPVD